MMENRKENECRTFVCSLLTLAKFSSDAHVPSYAMDDNRYVVCVHSTVVKLLLFVIFYF